METEKWHLAFDGCFTHRGGGPGVVLYAPDGTNISLTFKLNIFSTKNEAEYVVLIVGLISALKMGVYRLRVQGDSKLLIKQVNDEFASKEISLVP